ncbi:hypothetical protein CHS0354_025499 [Potamilus streckersoni]|uniref:EF-hand domain-containing protein n=1 Tax=Potamilus streckersoni TaxID=2493646 RepID=A0AAE0VYG7_9BIVA|nr:hypothetical protein CHS0354_025499 [Potamilus streckersoni]
MGDIAEALVELLRNECLARGFNSIKGLSVVFRAMDIDYSKRINFDELKEGVKKFGLRIPDNYMHQLFVAFDVNKSGGIDFCEFMYKLRPPLSKCRKDVINEAFDRLDANNDGSISIEDLKGKCPHLLSQTDNFVSKHIIMIQEGDSHHNHYDQQTSPNYGIDLPRNSTIRLYSHDRFFITTAAPVALVRQLSTVRQ